MLETLLQIDNALTLTINHFHSGPMDAVMAAISGKWTWLPLYALLLYLMYRELGWKATVVFLVAIALNTLLTDQISVFMKDHFMRLRPCHQDELIPLLHTPKGCGGQFGFVSSHAANTMGLAILVSLIFKRNWISIMMLVFALLNGYSRIYLGKHFAGDVAGGFILALIIGTGMYYLAQMVKQRLIKT